VIPAPAPGVEPTANQAADAKPAAIQPGASPEDRQKTYDAWKDRVLRRKRKWDLAARELERAQREYNCGRRDVCRCRQPLRSAGPGIKKTLDYKKKIEEKKKAADDAKEQLENMQEDARKAGVPTSVREEQ